MEDTVQKWCKAILENDRSSVSKLLKAYPEYLNHKNSSGQTAVYYASHYGSDTVLSFLLSAGADINVQEKNMGWTPLIVASNEGFDECVSLLIEAHAHLDIRDNDGCTALICAASNGHTNTVSSLLKAGANAYLNDGAWNALHYSIYMGKFEITGLLLDYGMDINDLFFLKDNIETVFKQKNVFERIEKRSNELSPEHITLWKKYRLQQLFN